MDIVEEREAEATTPIPSTSTYFPITVNSLESLEGVEDFQPMIRSENIRIDTDLQSSESTFTSLEDLSLESVTLEPQPLTGLPDSSKNSFLQSETTLPPMDASDEEDETAQDSKSPDLSEAKLSSGERLRLKSLRDKYKRAPSSALLFKKKTFVETGSTSLESNPSLTLKRPLHDRVGLSRLTRFRQRNSKALKETSPEPVEASPNKTENSLEDKIQVHLDNIEKAARKVLSQRNKKRPNFLRSRLFASSTTTVSSTTTTMLTTNPSSSSTTEDSLGASDLVVEDTDPKVHCVFHGTTAVLIVLGSIAMLSDAFGTREDWLRGMIIDLMDPTNSNHMIYKESFLGNMYRIVRCCGADGPQDYSFLFDISSPPECINHWQLGGRDYQRGCASAFSTWLKAWAGGISAGLIIAAAIEIFLIVIIWRQIKYIKITNLMANEETHGPQRELPPLPPRNHERERLLWSQNHPTPPQRIQSRQERHQMAPLHRTPSVRFGEVTEQTFSQSPIIRQTDQSRMASIQRQAGASSQATNSPDLPKRHPRFNAGNFDPPSRSRFPPPILKSSTDESSRRESTLRHNGIGFGRLPQGAQPEPRHRTTTWTGQGFPDTSDDSMAEDGNLYEDITSPSLPSPLANRRKKPLLKSRERSRSRESLNKITTLSREEPFSDDCTNHGRSPSGGRKLVRRKSSTGSIFPPFLSPHLNRRASGSNLLMDSSGHLAYEDEDRGQTGTHLRRKRSQGSLKNLFGLGSLSRSRSGRLNQPSDDPQPRGTPKSNRRGSNHDLRERNQRSVESRRGSNHDLRERDQRNMEPRSGSSHDLRERNHRSKGWDDPQIANSELRRSTSSSLEEFERGPHQRSRKLPNTLESQKAPNRPTQKPEEAKTRINPWDPIPAIEKFEQKSKIFPHVRHTRSRTNLIETAI
eukprot:maker-scaffold1312_size48844-snap-gene-0.8 protein:Tk02204 transcript:maker-scaffold1312_size48844-snap-gene-0.8-mRNA-1 annotation:"---NA---"